MRWRCHAIDFILLCGVQWCVERQRRQRIARNFKSICPIASKLMSYMKALLRNEMLLRETVRCRVRRRKNLGHFTSNYSAQDSILFSIKSVAECVQHRVCVRGEWTLYTPFLIHKLSALFELLFYAYAWSCNPSFRRPVHIISAFRFFSVSKFINFHRSESSCARLVEQLKNSRTKKTTWNYETLMTFSPPFYSAKERISELENENVKFHHLDDATALLTSLHA